MTKLREKVGLISFRFICLILYPRLSGGAEPKKNPTASVSGLSDIREFRPLAL